MADEREARRAALRRVAGLLKRTGLPFALAGSYGLWAHGAPESAHDVDFVIAEEHTEQIAADLAAAGLEVVRPPEDWLLKVPTDGVTVDLLHRLARRPATVEMLASSHVFEVLSVEMPVLDATDLLSSKLGALTEHFCDFAPLLRPPARSANRSTGRAFAQNSPITTLRWPSSSWPTASG